MDEFSWFVGLFEGEGTFNILHETKPLSIAISMTDLDTLQRVQSSFGGKIYETGQRNENWKKAWLWTLTGQSSYSLAIRMLPYLSARRAERCKTYTGLLEKRIERKNRLSDLKLRVLELRAEGLSLRKIGAELGIDHGYVGNIVRQYGEYGEMVYAADCGSALEIGAGSSPVTHPKHESVRKYMVL